MKNSPSIAIAGVKVRQDDEGRFNLNDLHKASGSEKKNQPSNWARTDVAEGLAEEIKNSSDMRSLPWARKEGRNGGTYVCKEMVYAYAMWISPAFHLKVIRAYDALVTGQLEMAEGRAAREAARLEAPFMAEAVKHQRESAGKSVTHYHFSNEHDLINRIALGMTAKKYRQEHGLMKSEPLRDTLTPCEMKCIEHLQRVNASLIDVGMAFEERKQKLSQIYIQRHSRALMEEIKRLEY